MYQAASGLPTLYSYVNCPYCLRARMALAAGGIPYGLCEVDLQNKPQSLLQLNPAGTVPVLVWGDQVITQSMDIVYAVLSHSDPLQLKQFILPQTEVKALLEENDSRFAKAMVRAKMPERFAHEADDTDWDEVARGFLAKLEKKLGSTPFLAAGSITLADICIAPHVLVYDSRKPEITSAFPCVKEWLERVKSHDIYRQAMVHHPVWVEGQPPAVID